MTHIFKAHHVRHATYSLCFAMRGVGTGVPRHTPPPPRASKKNHKGRRERNGSANPGQHTRIRRDLIGHQNGTMGTNTQPHTHTIRRSPPPPAALRAKGWVHDVLHDGDVEANRGPPTGAAAPALPESTSSVHPWNDSTTIGDITLFLGSTASTQTKISTLVALHHHLLQQCHLRCNTLPEEENNGTSRLPTDESAYAPNTPGSLQLGTTEIHATPLPRSPTGCLDLQCPNCGIHDFYLPRCSSCQSGFNVAIRSGDPTPAWTHRCKYASQMLARPQPPTAGWRISTPSP